MREPDGHRADMAKTRITDRLVRDMTAPVDGKQLIVRDNLVTGFGVRVTSRGFVSFVFNYVSNGVQRRLTIGSPPSWSVCAAREEAKKLRRLSDIGRDPLEERRAARNEETLAEVWWRYSSEVLSRRAPKTQNTVRSLWDRIVLPELGNRRLSGLLPQDFDRLHRKVSMRTPTQSNRMLASLQHVFSKAVQWRLVEANPVKGIERNPEDRRERYLSEDELLRFLRTLRGRPQTPSTLAIAFLLLTGARSGETFKSRWSEFDLKKGIWEKPSAHTKTRRTHRVPLAPEALDVLLAAQQIKRNDYVFSGRKGDHLTTVKTIFASILDEANIRHFRVHDLRHSFASFLICANVPLPTIGRLLGHTQAVTTSRYAHLDDRVLRSATQIIGRKTRRHGE